MASHSPREYAKWHRIASGTHQHRWMQGSNRRASRTATAHAAPLARNREITSTAPCSVAKLLSQHDADHTRTHRQSTAFYRAAGGGHRRIPRLLLRNLRLDHHRYWRIQPVAHIGALAHCSKSLSRATSAPQTASREHHRTGLSTLVYQMSMMREQGSSAAQGASSTNSGAPGSRASARPSFLPGTSRHPADFWTVGLVGPHSPPTHRIDASPGQQEKTKHNRRHNHEAHHHPLMGEQPKQHPDNYRADPDDYSCPENSGRMPPRPRDRPADC